MYNRRLWLAGFVLGCFCSTTVSAQTWPNTQSANRFFNDDFGSRPVDPAFDAEPGALCGNGRSFFPASAGKGKPTPDDWKSPPPPGTDPEYEGPGALDIIRESPYAMPSARVVLARAPIVDHGDSAGFFKSVQKLVSRSPGGIGFLSTELNTPADLGVPVRFLEVTQFRGDESSATQVLRSAAVRYVLIDRSILPVKPWLESEYQSLLIRLRDGLPLDHFRLKVIGSRYALYEVASPPVLERGQKAELTRYVRAILGGASATAPEFSIHSAPAFTVISLRMRGEPLLKGRKLVQRSGRGDSTALALADSVKRLRESWDDTRRRNASMKLGSLAEVLPRIQIEIDTYYDFAEITDRSVADLVWYFELGLEGLYLKKSDSFFFLEPSHALQRGVDTEEKFLTTLLARSNLTRFLSGDSTSSGAEPRLNFEAWNSDRGYEFGRFSTINWIETEDQRDIVEIYRGVPLVPLAAVTRDAVVRALRLGAGWLMKHQHPDGQFAYQYKPLNREGRRWAFGGNIVRHALNPYSLLLVNTVAPDPELIERAKLGIRFTLSFLRRHGSRCVICHRDPPAPYYNAKIGTVAVSILSLLKLAAVSDISEFKDALHCLSEELLFMQDRNGHIRQYDVPTEHPYYGVDNTIAPGQLILVLARLYKYTKDERFLAAAKKALPYYMTAWRGLCARRTKEGIYTDEDRANIVGIIPWLVMGLNELHQIEPRREYVDNAFELQGWVDDELFYYENRSQYPDYLGSAYKLNNEPPAINACQFLEGASALYDMARRANRDVEKRREIVALGMRFCMQLQYESYATTFFLPAPDEALGAFRYHLVTTRSRNDYSYHSIAALGQAVNFLEPRFFPDKHAYLKSSQR